MTFRSHRIQIVELTWMSKLASYCQSCEGYDISRKGSKVDYGSDEYAMLLELLSLLEPELLVSLDSMRSSWRTYLALWVPNRTRAHTERLGDIIEIVMAAS